MKKCFSCNRELAIEGTPGRGEVCPHCNADVKVCLNCDFHEMGSYNECKEPQAERVVDKNRSNFCGYFRFRSAEGAADREKKEKLKELEDLFKK